MIPGKYFFQNLTCNMALELKFVEYAILSEATPSIKMVAKKPKAMWCDIDRTSYEKNIRKTAVLSSLGWNL
jgi:hypothetical protein